MKNIISIIRTCILTGFILISGSAFAQSSMTVKGTVKDTKGEVLVGAAVMLDGTTTGVVTDIDGKYTITFTPKAGKTPVLVYSSISYITQEIKRDENSVSLSLLIVYHKKGKSQPPF